MNRPQRPANSVFWYPRTVYRYFWAYPFLLFSFYFFLFFPLLVKYDEPEVENVARGRKREFEIDLGFSRVACSFCVCRTRSTV